MPTLTFLETFPAADAVEAFQILRSGQATAKARTLGEDLLGVQSYLEGRVLHDQTVGATPGATFQALTPDNQNHLDQLEQELKAASQQTSFAATPVAAAGAFDWLSIVAAILDLIKKFRG